MCNIVQIQEFTLVKVHTPNIRDRYSNCRLINNIYIDFFFRYIFKDDHINIWQQQKKSHTYIYLVLWLVVCYWIFFFFFVIILRIKMVLMKKKNWNIQIDANYIPKLINIVHVYMHIINMREWNQMRAHEWHQTLRHMWSIVSKLAVRGRCYYIHNLDM